MSYFQLEDEMFGKTIKIGVFDVEKEIAVEILNESYAYGKKIEKIFNIYDEESEISLLNKKRKMEISEDFLVVLKKALKYCKISNGQYDISLGKQFLDRKSSNEVGEQKCSYEDVIIKNKEVTLKNGNVWIDLGSIAKGYIADKIVEFLKEKGVKSGMVDARGDLILFGNIKHKVLVQHPRNPEKEIYCLEIKNSAVATSGDYNQYDKTYEKSHIINQKELVSVTVVTKKLIDADVLASVVFLLNEKEREEFIAKNRKVKVIIVDKELNMKKYNF